MVAELSRPLPTRSPTARLLDDINVIIRRARELERANVPALPERRLSIETHRSAVRSLRKSGRSSLHRTKCREMLPMRMDLYYIACDAILAIVAKDHLNPSLRQLLVADWLRVSDLARKN